MKLVNTCIKELAEQFPSSLRVSMLEGLKYEYLKKWDDALEMLVGEYLLSDAFISFSLFWKSVGNLNVILNSFTTLQSLLMLELVSHLVILEAEALG